MGSGESIATDDLTELVVAMREAAGAEGISFETARTRLKAIFDKTGTGRQAELAALVGRVEWVIDSSISVAVIVTTPASLARRRMSAWINGIRSKGNWTPRSPRATMMPAASPRISSRLA